MKHKFPYKWNLKDGYPEKNGLKVFSCFACGGGSTMGYKLAGYEVLGANEIDPKMAECYKVNHNPKYLYVEPIQEFKLRKDLPRELYNLDILDGSPPCSSFSMAGNREKDWGKEKKFREGQADQVLDTLFFDFIDLAERLQPKVVIAENVKGLLLGDAKKYVWQIYQAFDKAGYYVHKWLLDASKMGVPQRRERVFFVAIRKDLTSKIDCAWKMDLFNPMPHLDLEFDEPEIVFSQIEEVGAQKGDIKVYPSILEMWQRTTLGKTMTRKSGATAVSHYKLHPDKVLDTIIASEAAGPYHHEIPRSLTKNEYCNAGSYPEDYEFMGNMVKYLIGMSVPPVMTAQIASRIREQWFDRMRND